MQREAPYGKDTSIGAYVVLLEQRRKAYWERGLATLAKYPNDPLRWRWLLAAVQMQRFYFSDDTATVREAWNNGREATLKVDTAARDVWERQFKALRDEFMASPQVTDAYRQSFRFVELRSTVWPKRVALKRGEIKDVQEYLTWYQQELLTYASGEKASQARSMANFIFSSREFRVLGDSIMLAFLRPLKASKNTELRLFASAKERLIQLRTTPLEMRFATMDGGTFDLAQMRGKVVLIDFWTTGCSSCIAGFPKIKTLYEQYRNKGFEVVTVSLDPEKNREKVLEIINRYGLPWQQVLVGGTERDDNEYVRRYQIYGVPEMFLVDQRGFLVQNGYINGEELRVALKQMVDE